MVYIERLGFFTTIFSGSLEPIERVFANREDKRWHSTSLVDMKGGQQNFVQRARANHKTVDERVKIFGNVRRVFRHCLHLHRYVFHAVVKLTVLKCNPLDLSFSL